MQLQKKLYAVIVSYPTHDNNIMEKICKLICKSLGTENYHLSSRVKHYNGDT